MTAIVDYEELLKLLKEKEKQKISPPMPYIRTYANMKHDAMANTISFGWIDSLMGGYYDWSLMYIGTNFNVLAKKIWG